MVCFKLHVFICSQVCQSNQLYTPPPPKENSGSAPVKWTASLTLVVLLVKTVGVVKMF